MSMGNIRAYLVLMRPPNLLTALADIMAGFAISTAFYHHLGSGTLNVFRHDQPWTSLILTGIASICLYGGGVVLNDYFDTKLDRVERPERPIPSGLVSRSQALILGMVLLALGVALAFLSNFTSGLIALIIAILVISYDVLAKHHGFFGPVNMGLCRGANLLLGISIFPEFTGELAFMMIIPIIYIAAITLVSRGEVHGSSRTALSFAFSLYLLTVTMVVSLLVLDQFRIWHSLPFLILLMTMVIPPLYRARSADNPSLVGKAVKHGVLGLILLDAALASGFAGWFFGLLLLLLLPFSMLLAKKFAVT